MDVVKFLAALRAKISSLKQVSLVKYRELLIAQGFEIVLLTRTGLPGQVGSCKVIVKKGGCRYSTSLDNIVIN